MDKDFFDYISGTLTMLASVGTFGAFVFLFRRDQDKQKQIDSLSSLARAAEEQLMLSVRPDLYKNGAMSNPGTAQISIDLLNRGEQAKLTEFKTNSEDIFLHSEGLPHMLNKDSERQIFAQSNGKNTNNCEYLISVFYEDKLGNKFQLDITGIGSEVSFGDPKLLKHRYS